jgi:hypothetical protein
MGTSGFLGAIADTAAFTTSGVGVAFAASLAQATGVRWRPSRFNSCRYRSQRSESLSGQKGALRLWRPIEFAHPTPNRNTRVPISFPAASVVRRWP